jgi:hypothetical protein
MAILSALATTVASVRKNAGNMRRANIRPIIVSSCPCSAGLIRLGFIGDY